MGQDLQAHDRKWLEGFPRKQGTRSLETITETGSFRNGNRTRDLWKSTRVLLPSLMQCTPVLGVALPPSSPERGYPSCSHQQQQIRPLLLLS